MEMKKRIKNDIDNYEIKTTSKDILNQTTKKKRSLSFIKFGIPTLTAALAALVLVLIFIPKRPEYRSLLETISYSAVSSVESTTKAQKRNLNGSESTYDVYELVAKTEALLENKIEITTVESDKAEYEHKSELTYLGNVYELYIVNKIVEEEKEYDDEDDEDEYEKETKYNGILVSEGVEYRFEAKEEYEEEREGLSYEVEMELYFKLYLSDTSYIVVDQEIETEDNEYEESFRFMKYVDGVKVSDYEVSKEIEDNEEVLKYESKGLEYKLTFYTENGESYLKVKYNGNKDTYKVTSTEVDGQIVKTYTLVLQ